MGRTSSVEKKTAEGSSWFATGSKENDLNTSTNPLGLAFDATIRVFVCSLSAQSTACQSIIFDYLVPFIMPHPRLQEGSDDEGLAPIYVDAEAQVLSEITYKDLARPYTHFVRASISGSGGTTMEEDATQEVAEAKVTVNEQQPVVVKTTPSDPSGVNGLEVSTTITDASGRSSTQPSSLQQVSMLTTGSPQQRDPDAKMQKQQQNNSNNFMNQRRYLILAVLVVLVLGCVVGVSVGLLATGDDKNKEDSVVLPEPEEPVIAFTPYSGPLNGERGSGFGFALSLNHGGTRMAVGGRSRVHVYEEGNAKWNEMGGQIEVPFNTTMTTGLVANGTVYIRTSVVVKMSGDGNSIAVGWSRAEDDRGVVSVFRYNQQEKEWKSHGDRLIGAGPGHYFGASLDLSDDGSLVAVASPGKGGTISIYAFNAGVWQNFGTQIRNEDIGGLTITSVALARDGRTLGFGGLAGKVETIAHIFAFDVTTGDWKEMGTGLQSQQNGTAYVVDLSGDGSTVVLSNYYYLVSNPGENNDAIDVRGFEWSEELEDWQQQGNALHTSMAGKKSGYFISLSDDGRAMVMGDPGRIGASGGANSGHSHVYVYNGESWEQLGPNINGTSPGNHFGYSVAMSGDGKRFAASAPFSRELGTVEPHGQVLVFEIPSQVA